MSELSALTYLFASYSVQSPTLKQPTICLNTHIMVLASANPCDPEPNKSAWLSLMEQLSSEEELQRHEKRLVDVLRQMFEASGNDETRARTAARHITSIFHDSMSGNMPKFDQESLVLFYIDTFETIVLELAKAVQFPSTEHRRLVSFILQLRDMTNELLEAPVRLH